MSGFLTSLVWRGDYPAVPIYGEEVVDLDKTGARAVLARMADNCSDNGDLMLRIGRNLIAEDVRLSVERVKKIQAAWVKLGVLRPVEDEGGRGRFVYYEIDVDRLVSFIEDKRLPKAWRRDRAELSPDNRVVGDPDSKPGRREDETGSPRGETGSPDGDKPGRGRPPSDKPLEQSLDEMRARGVGDPDGPPPSAAEGPCGGIAAGTATAEDAASGLGALEGPSCGASAPRQMMSDADRERMWRQNFIIDWLIDGKSPAMVCERIGFSADRMSEAEFERAALSQRATYVKGVFGFVKWAEACLAGDVAADPPIAPVKRLMASLADPARRALMARRLALIRDKDAEIRAAEQADGEAA